jgi:cytoskeleton protein RodZ
MASVASELKAEREKRNIPLAQIAADTRISLHYLESLEEGRYGDLPGGMYNRAFLKAYCEILNLDQQEIMNRYEAEVSPLFDRQSKSRPQVPHARSFRLSPILIWSIMLLISASGVFFSRKWIARIFSPYFSHTPAANLRYEPPLKSPSPAAVPALPATPDEAGKVPPEPAPPASRVPGDIITSPAKSAAAPPNLPAPKEASPVPASVPALRLDLQVDDKCWISVSSDGHPIAERTLEPGETQSFNAAEQLSVTLGNAGGVRLRLNGKAVRPLGKPGDVIRMIINQKNLQEFIDQTAG